MKLKLRGSLRKLCNQNDIRDCLIDATYNGATAVDSDFPLSDVPWRYRICKDYQQMEEMFPWQLLAFDEILQMLEALKRRINSRFNANEVHAHGNDKNTGQSRAFDAE
jgi:hypothetical protein